MSLKAFDLVPVIDRVEVRISCFEACGNVLYLGTEDGRVLCYSVAERTDSDTGNTTYSNNMLAQVQLSSKHEVTCLGAASGVGRLLALVDGIIHLLDHKTLVTVATASKIKGVTTFCLSHNPVNPDPFALEVGIGRRRCIQLLLVQDDRVSVCKEASCSDPPVAICVDGVWVCIAAGGQYSLYNLETGAVTPLFPYDTPTVPLIRRIVKEEFLLDGPGGLGMFVTCDGVSIRPPINWSDEVLSVTYHHPYVLTVTPHFIRVYSVVDQQVKQTVRFSSGILVGNFDGQVYLASPTSVHCLLPQPWYKQVQLLISEERVEEAVELCEEQRQFSDSSNERLVLSVLQRAGFIRLQQEQYNNAADYFIRGRLDPRELLHLFPGVLPSSCSFVRTVPALHQIIDLPTLCKGDSHRLARAINFTVEYLLASRSNNSAYAVEVDTALIKLMCRQGNSEELLRFIALCPGGFGERSGSISSSSVCLECDVAECAEELKKHSMYVCLERLYSATGSPKEGIQVALKLLKGEVSDPLYSGPEYVRDVLRSCGDPSLVLKYCPLLLECDHMAGVTLFTSKDGLQFKPQQVLELLERFPDAKAQYLHYLVDEEKVQDEPYHTSLALHYAERAVQMASELKAGADDCPEFTQLKEELIGVLNTSDYYDASAVLSCVKRCPALQRETAALLGRLGDHEKALQLLVRQMRDFRAAEEYCASQLVQHRRRRSSSATLGMWYNPPLAPPPPLYLLMLKAYLTPLSDGAEEEEEVVAPLDLLSSHSTELPLAATLQLLPAHWTLTLTSSFVSNALAQLRHKRRMATLQCGLARCTVQQQTSLLSRLQQNCGPVTLTQHSVCSVCLRQFSSPCGSDGPVLFPNGVVAHRQCTPEPSICPLTGTCVANTFTAKN